MTAHSVKLIDRNSSDQIKYARIICIFFMIMVHIPPGLTSIPESQHLLSLLVIFTNDILGRASVSALSFVSGFLIYFSLQNKSWSAIASNRFVTLIIPMMFWNVAIIATGFAILFATGQKIYSIENLEGLSLFSIVIDRMMCINYGCASDSLNFLRDIFVCVLLASPIVFICQKLKNYAWLMILLIAIVDSTLSYQPLIMRGMILIFFTAGIVYAQNINGLAQISKLRYIALIAFIPVILMEYDDYLFDMFNGRFYGYEIFKRVTVSILVIDFSLFLTRQIQHRLIDRIDRGVYFIFLSHNVFFILSWGVWQLMFGKGLEFPYLIYFLMAPISWVIACSFCLPWLGRLPKFIQIIIAGRQYKSEDIQNKAVVVKPVG